MNQPDRIADALVMTQCATASLAQYLERGMLERELALPRLLSRRYGRVVMATWGGARDVEIAARYAPEIEVVVNGSGDDPAVYAGSVPVTIRERLRSCRSVVVECVQMWGGELALETARELRESGVRCGMVARAGYPWSRFMALERGAASHEAREAAAVEEELVRGADAVVVTTREMAEDFQWRYGVEGIRIVPNYVLEDATPEPERDREPGSVVFAGRLESQKRVELLLEAMSRLPEDLRERARLTVIGEGTLEPALRARASALGVRAEFRPRVGHRVLLDELRRCAVYAQASSHEGHPKTVLEAMAVGAPVVVARAPGLTEVVRHGTTGLVAEADASSLADAIARVMRDGVLAERLGRAGSRAMRALSLERIEPLAAEAQRAALSRAGEGTAEPPGAVRWSPGLLRSAPEVMAEAWGRSLQGFTRRLTPETQGRFAMLVDARVDEVQNRAAMAAGAGVHPKHRVTRYHAFFAERIAPGERVLDLGCGYGAVAATIAERLGVHVTGMDLNRASLEQARALVRARGLEGRVELMEGDITADRARGTFDVVVLSNVLEHLRERPAVLTRCAEWYRPRRILVRVPAFDRDWKTAWKRELGLDYRCDSTHEIEYTEETLREELAEAGLAVSELIVRWGEYWAVAQPARVASIPTTMAEVRGASAVA